MTTNPTTQSATSPITAFDSERFEVNRIETVHVDSESTSISFEITVEHHLAGQKIFCGLLDRDLQAGMGLAVDTMTGELIDLINNQGIIGYLNTSPITEGDPFTLRLTMDKFGSTHICSAHIAGEKILYPSVLLDSVSEIGAVVGSTLTDSENIVFKNPKLQVIPSATATA